MVPDDTVSEISLAARGLVSSLSTRLKRGVTLEQARADMERVTGNLAQSYPETNKGRGAVLLPLKEEMVGPVRPVLLGDPPRWLIGAWSEVARVFSAIDLAAEPFEIRSADCLPYGANFACRTEPTT